MTAPLHPPANSPPPAHGSSPHGSRPRRYAYFLVGTTATGKTAVAQWIAERHGMDILSADSMLVYRGLDIGTAKPAGPLRERVRYYGLDLTTPDRSFSAGDYLRHARAAWADERTGETPVSPNGLGGARLIVVGGTGLYLRCLTHGLDVPGPAGGETRARWEAVHARHGVEALQNALRECAPVRYEALSDKRNPRRLIRALELACAGTDAVGRDPEQGWVGGPFVGLQCSPADLERSIRRRVRTMYEAGLLAEVTGLVQRYGVLSRTARKAIGYEEALLVMAGACTMEAGVEQTVLRTRRLAKRQRTWFRHQAEVRWVEVDPDAGVEETAGQVVAHWRQYGPTGVTI